MGAGATPTMGGLSLAQSPRLAPGPPEGGQTAVGGNVAAMWSLGYGLCPRPGRGPIRSET